MHLCTPFGHFIKEICMLVFLDGNGRESWICLYARGWWWSPGTMMWAKIPIHPQWTQANTFLETVLPARVVALSPSPMSKGPCESWNVMVLGTGRKAMRSWDCAPEWKLILSLVHRVTAWVRCVHTSSAGTSRAGSHRMGTSCMDPGVWVHPRQAPRTSIQSVPRRHRCRSLARSLSGELSREWACRRSPKVRWWLLPGVRGGTPPSSTHGTFLPSRRLIPRG